MIIITNAVIIIGIAASINPYAMKAPAPTRLTILSLVTLVNMNDDTTKNIARYPTQSVKEI